MDEKIEEYFDICSGRIRKHIIASGKVFEIPDPAPMHITGLCVHLGITRETLSQYSRKPEFSDSIARAKMRCEAYAVDMCFEGKKGNKADFILQNNFNWKNKASQDNNDSIVIRTIYIEPEEKEAYERHITAVIDE